MFGTQYKHILKQGMQVILIMNFQEHRAEQSRVSNIVNLNSVLLYISAPGGRHLRP